MEIWDCARLIRYYSTDFIILTRSPKSWRWITSILSAMELPVAILVFVIVLHEVVSTLQLFGIVLVLIGMTLPPYLSTRKAKLKHNLSYSNEYKDILDGDKYSKITYCYRSRVIFFNQYHSILYQ